MTLSKPFGRSQLPTTLWNERTDGRRQWQTGAIISLATFRRHRMLLLMLLLVGGVATTTSLTAKER